MRELNGSMKLAGFVLAIMMALGGSLAYLHGTFVTYREFTAALATLRIPPNARLASDGFAESAWEKALRLANATEVERTILVRPHVWYVPEPRFVVVQDKPARLCGYALPTLDAKQLDPAALRGDVIIFMRPAENAITLDVVTHEFLHHVWLYRVLTDDSFLAAHPNAESWIRMLLPTKCPEN